MIANSLLVRWAFGWHEVKGNYTPQLPADPPVDLPYRREALLGLGGVQSEIELVRVAGEQLGWLADPRTEVVADLAPVGDDDTPHLAFDVGDFVTVPDNTGTPVVERVVGLTVTEDEHGTVTFAPELKDRVLADYERWQRNLDKMSAGTVAGNSAVANPIADTLDMGKDCCAPMPLAFAGIHAHHFAGADPPSDNYANPSTWNMVGLRAAGSNPGGALIHGYFIAGWGDGSSNVATFSTSGDPFDLTIPVTAEIGPGDYHFVLIGNDAADIEFWAFAAGADFSQPDSFATDTWSYPAWAVTATASGTHADASSLLTAGPSGDPDVPSIVHLIYLYAAIAGDGPVSGDSCMIDVWQHHSGDVEGEYTLVARLDLGLGFPAGTYDTYPDAEVALGAGSNVVLFQHGDLPTFTVTVMFLERGAATVIDWPT